METLELNKKSQRRGKLLNNYLSNNITKLELMSLLGLSLRQTDRVIKSYCNLGLSSLVHGNKYRVPVNKLHSIISERIIVLAAGDGKYSGFNICHLQDMLLKDESIDISISSLRRILVRANVLNSASIKPSHRRRRKRSSSEGLMIQIDGSTHDWLCGRGDKMCLMGAVDDATGRLVYAGFRPSEDQCGYIQMFRSISMNYGIPGSCYHDKHTILRSPKESTIEDELDGKKAMSQVQRIMHELGIESIPANSPQAKGRIERLRSHLKMTSKHEMTLAGDVNNIQEANAFLETFIKQYNEKFSKQAENPESSWVALEEGMDIEYYFSILEQRIVNNDYTISWHSKIFQLANPKNTALLPKAKVNVHTTPEGVNYIYLNKKRLEFKTIEEKPIKLKDDKKIKLKTTPSPQNMARKRAWLYGNNHAA